MIYRYATICLSVDGYLVYFYFLAIMNDGVMNIACKFLCEHMFKFSWVYTHVYTHTYTHVPRSITSGSYRNFWRNYCCFFPDKGDTVEYCRMWLRFKS